MKAYSPSTRGPSCDREARSAPDGVTSVHVRLPVEELAVIDDIADMDVGDVELEHREIIARCRAEQKRWTEDDE